MKKKITVRVSIFLLYLFINYSFKNLNFNTNEQFTKNLLKQSNYHFIYEEKESLLTSLFSIFKISFNEPVTIIDKVLAYNTEDNKQEEIQVFNYNSNKPKVYIYSTHPNEEYSSGIEGHNIDLDIVSVSHLLKDELIKRNIDVIVEEKRSDNYIKENNLEFKDSYLATREFLKEKLSNYDFDLIIDLHRDYVSKTNSTVTINEINYAKVMFVVNVNYKNKDFAKEINDSIESKYKGLSRGLYKKYVDNFNQDLDEKVVLIELGGHKNTIDEVTNTVDALADSIKELLL